MDTRQRADVYQSAPLGIGHSAVASALWWSCYILGFSIFTGMSLSHILIVLFKLKSSSRAYL